MSSWPSPPRAVSSSSPAAIAGAAVASRTADGRRGRRERSRPASIARHRRDRRDGALLPRWRRPSLLQARKTDPIRDTDAGPRLTFDHGLVGPLDGRERRVIRYRVVRLLDSPDELRGAEIGYLDQGDEVQLLEKYGAYWLVLCPDGRQGWLHKMTLGDVVGDDAAATTARGRRCRSPPTPGRWASDIDERRPRRPTSSRAAAATDAPARCAAPGCAGGRCSGRRPADSRTAVAASRPGTR